MKAKMRRKRAEENKGWPVALTVLTNGKTEDDWTPTFLMKDEDHHPHEERLDCMTENELRSCAVSTAAAYEKNVGDGQRAHWCESLCFELWLIRRVAERKEWI